MDKHFERYSYRCLHCLAVFAVPAQLTGDISCDICKDLFEYPKIEYMGAVIQDKAVPIELRCKCDDRCTTARGPRCDCQCGGVNHQRGIEAYTQVLRHDQSVALTCTDPATKEKHYKIAKEFKTAYDAKMQLLEALPGYQDFIDKKWIDRSKWEKIFYGRKGIVASMSLKTQASRLKKLNSIHL